MKNVMSNFVINDEFKHKKIVYFYLLNRYRAKKSDTNRINMVRDRKYFKEKVRK